MGRLGTAVVLLGISLAAPTAHTQPPDALDLLDRVRETYGALESYLDQGVLVRTRVSGEETLEQRFRFRIASQRGGDFLFRVELESEPPRAVKAVWRDSGADWQYETGMERPEAVESLPVAVVGIIGRGGLDALLVPLLLAEGEELWQPPAASLEGEEPCGESRESRCFVIAVAPVEVGAEPRLWIDMATGLIRRVEVRLMRPSELEPLKGFGSGVTTLELVHEIESVDERLGENALRFVPPPQTASDEQEVADFVLREEISVELRTLAVRVLDTHGRPIRGLEPEDFRVRLGKEEIPIVAVDWISSRTESVEQSDPVKLYPPSPGQPRDETEGQLIVLFVQADLNPARVKGQLRLRPYVKEFLSSVDPKDWVAVISFDSHLKLWLDFSRDREEAFEVFDRAFRFGDQPVLHRGRSRSLVNSFPFRKAKKAASPERALRLTAEALRDIPGEKVMVYLGWGLGRYGSNGFNMTAEYSLTRRALEEAKTSVFVLDVTDADYHTLELGIRQVAIDTGGTYAKTNLFAERAVDRLIDTLAGYYLLTLDRETLPAEAEKLRITVPERKAEVFLRKGRLSRR